MFEENQGCDAACSLLRAVPSDDDIAEVNKMPRMSSCRHFPELSRDVAVQGGVLRARLGQGDAGMQVQK